jgi:hypothetical protein
MGLLIGLGKGTVVTAAILLAFALLKKLIIVFGILLAVLKFAIVIAFLALFISIAVAMIRDWSNGKNGFKDA